jgi:hypothetical protein
MEVIMMKYLVLLLLLLPGCLLADTTNVQGPLFGTWTAGDVFFVMGDISIPTSRVLTVEEGVRVKFFGSFSITVSGSIVTQGTADNPVVFTCDTVLFPSRWRGIRIAGGMGDFDYTTIEHASNNLVGDEAASGVNCNAGELTMTDCIVQHCRSRPPIGVYNGSTAHIERCTLKRNYLSVGCCGGGIGIRGDSHADIIDCDIYDNSALDGAGIYVNEASSANITGTRIALNHAHTWGGGVYVEGSGQVIMRKCYILYNDVNGSGGGMKARGDNLLVEQCTFVGNESNNGAHVNCDMGQADFNSCIFAPFNGEYGLGAALVVLENTQITHSLVYTFFTDYSYGGTLPEGLGALNAENTNGDSCDQYQNIYLDPMFHGSIMDDFSLLRNSPCIDAGDPLLPHDPDSTVADIGVDYYNQTNPIDPRRASLPVSPEFHAAYPNPFNPNTTLSFSLSVPSAVTLRVMDLLGRTVEVLVDETMNEGTHSLQWNAVSQPSGLYFAELTAGDFRQVQKLVLMK